MGLRCDAKCGAAQFAMLAFEDMAKLARPSTVTEWLEDDAVTRLLLSLSAETRPADVLRVLTAMQVRGLPGVIPANLVCARWLICGPGGHKGT